MTGEGRGGVSRGGRAGEIRDSGKQEERGFSGTGGNKYVALVCA
jgi:hypothetical protein